MVQINFSRFQSREDYDDFNFENARLIDDILEDDNIIIDKNTIISKISIEPKIIYYPEEGIINTGMEIIYNLEEGDESYFYEFFYEGPNINIPKFEYENEELLHGESKFYPVTLTENYSVNGDNYIIPANTSIKYIKTIEFIFIDPFNGIANVDIKLYLKTFEDEEFSYVVREGEI